MSARRALVEPQFADASTTSAIAFQAAPARRALIEEDLADLAIYSMSTARRGSTSTLAFEPDEPLTATTQLPKLTDRYLQSNNATKTKVRRTAAALATAVAAGAFVVLPNTVRAVSAQDIDAARAAHEQNTVTRDAERTELSSPMTAADAQLASNQASVAQSLTEVSAQKAEDARLAAEEQARQEAEAEAAAEAERQAEADRQAEQEAQAAQQNTQQSVAQSEQVVWNASEASGTAAGAMSYALAQVGKDYSWGATGPNAYDCSGLVYAAYAANGITLPRTSSAMLGAGTAVSLADIAPGDIVIMYGGGHAAMYIGNGQIVHAVDYGIGVIVGGLDTSAITGIRRVA